jgi:hypothetical protein
MRAKEFITEAHSTFPEEHSGPMTGMKRYDKLDNSNPYQMWRFLVAAAGQPLDQENGHPMPLKSPTGQKMTTLAYSQADADILDATSRAMGEPGTEISSQESTEPSFTNKTSPVLAFKGYKRK